jgi:hypothetical protein
LAVPSTAWAAGLVGSLREEPIWPKLRPSSTEGDALAPIVANWLPRSTKGRPPCGSKWSYATSWAALIFSRGWYCPCPSGTEEVSSVGSKVK